MLTLFLDWRVQLSHRRGTGTALCALAIALGLVLIGCGKGSEPVPTAAPTSTETAPSTSEPSKGNDAPEPTAEPTTPEPTPEPIPPDPAQLINENTEEGAKSAAKYFLDLYHYSLTSLDLPIWEERTSKDCEFCSSSSQKIADLTRDKNTIVGGEISIVEYLNHEEFIPKVWELKVVITQERIQKLDQAGAILVEDHPENWTADIFLGFEDSRWILLDIGK